jgi:hypothetical protein
MKQFILRLLVRDARGSCITHPTPLLRHFHHNSVQIQLISEDYRQPRVYCTKFRTPISDSPYGIYDEQSGTGTDF